MQRPHVRWVLLVVAVTSGGCTDRGSAPAGTAPGAPVQEPAVRIKDPKDLGQAPDIQMTADEYFAEWQKDAEAARKKFAWKVTELTGTVNGFRSVGGASFVELAVKGQARNVRCATTDPRPWDPVSDGQAVRIRGRVVGLGDAFELYHCVVVEATGPKAPPLTAARLGAGLDADPAAATAQYKNKGLVVQGTLARKERVGKYEVRLYFQTGSATPVYAEVVSLKVEWTEKVQPGDKLRVVGNFSSVSAKKELALGFAADAGPAD